MQLKNALILLLCFCFANGYSQNKTVTSDEGLHVPYDTIHLKNGYLLIKEKNDSHKFLRLKGPTVDTIIQQINNKALERNLGQIAMDHDEYFALVGELTHLGLGMQVFLKSTGKRFLDGCIIEKDTIQNIVYFAEWKDDHTQCIFDMETMKIELFSPPKTSCLWWWDCLVSKKITDAELTIEYYVPPNNKVKKTYKRQPG
jgi:hypothetical protein